MDRFHELEVFVRVAEHGGFAAAARALGKSAPTVTRLVANLEERLGTRLLVRSTRSIRLTESGERLLNDGRRVLADLAEAEDAAIGAHGEPRGELRITAPVLFGRLYVTPVLGDFLDAYPNVVAETLYVDRNVSLMDEGLDVAVRIGPLRDSSLSAVRVGHVRRVVVAAPAYIKRCGRPDHPDDLAGHRIASATAVTPSTEWSFLDHDGAPLRVNVAPTARLNTNDAVIELIARGWGISRLMSYQAAPLIAEGRLCRLLERFEPDPLPVHVLHQEGRRVSGRVRAFVDFLRDRLRAEPAVNGG